MHTRRWIAFGVVLTVVLTGTVHILSAIGQRQHNRISGRAHGGCLTAKQMGDMLRQYGCASEYAVVSVFGSPDSGGDMDWNGQHIRSFRYTFPRGDQYTVIYDLDGRLLDSGDKPPDDDE